MENKKRKNWIIFLPVILLLMFVSILLAGCYGSEINLKLTSPFNKIEYYLGEELDVNGGVLTYTDENKREKIVVVEENFVTGFDSSTPGNKIMTIVYENETVTVAYVVKNFRLGEYLATKMLSSDGEVIQSELPYMSLEFNSNGSMVLSQQLEDSSIGTVVYKFGVDTEGNLEFQIGDDTGTAHNLTAYYLNDCVYLNSNSGTRIVFELVA